MMKKLPISFLLMMFTAAGVLNLFAASPAEPVLLWSDEFDVDGLPDPDKWLYDVGGGGWGNNEEQYYTEARLENARVENGVLIIEARDDGWPLTSRLKTNDYTSARIVSKGRGDVLYGRIEARAKMPAGRGTWPAIWMLSTGNEYGVWPRSGEIDIMEHVGFEMNRVHGSLHTLNFNWASGGNPTGDTMVTDIDTTFYTYSVDWTPESISFAIDGNVYFTQEKISDDWEDWPFDQAFHVILNVAVGGFWGGQQGIDPDIWPQTMEVDYVRIYDIGDTVPLDTDGDQVPNATDDDDDGDGLSDVEEHGLGTNLLASDTDGDGFSDGDEVAAETNPLLPSSYPGADPSILLVNPDFIAGPDPWIVHTNRLNAAGAWQGQVGSWGGTYGVFDWVTPGESSFTFAHYDAGDAPRAEHLLYQEWSGAVAEIVPGDVIRFRGTASLASGDEATFGTAFIRVLDFAFMPREDTVQVELGPDPVNFALEATIAEPTFNVVQVGFLINGAQTDAATVTFSNLLATHNGEPFADTWADWPMTGNAVDTGDFMGWLEISYAPWIWSYSMDGWIYMPEENVSDNGSWVFVPR
jgi:beta-glucanase (GH16 family)